MTHHANDGSPEFPAELVGPGPDAGGAAERLTRLTHDLRGLLDGSLRWLSLAERGIEATPAETRDRIETVRVALVRMAGLIAEASEGRDTVDALLTGTTWRESVSHAVEALRLRAADAGCWVRAEIDEEAGAERIGALYSVVLNGLTNAIESVERANRALKGGGEVVARVFRERRDGAVFTVVEIEDDGEGPPVEGDPNAVFLPGFSTRNPGRGIGLGLAGELVRSVGGTIELREGAGERAGRPGAVLRVRVPASPPGPAGEHGAETAA